MDKRCKLLSVDEPGYSTALEFNDGKIMLADMDPISNITWEKIKQVVGSDEIIKIFTESDLTGIVNWGEMDNVGLIWESLLKEVPFHSFPKKQIIVVFDLCDCSNRGKDRIIEAVQLMEKFMAHCKVILSLNVNEANRLDEVLCNSSETVDLRYVGTELKKRVEIDALVIHHTKRAIAWEGDAINEANTFYGSIPMLSTGGGDNFNAGLILG